MWRASALAVALALTAAPAAAGKKKPHHAHAVERAAPDVRAELASELAAQADAIAKALVAVGDKLAAADDTRVRRLRAAARVLHALPAAGDGDRMAVARTHAAAKLLLERDAAERALLADEAERLATARGRIAGASEELPRLALPTELACPVAGAIASLGSAGARSNAERCAGVIVRHFGPIEHDHSHAQLARRGLDFEVEDRAAVIASADGVVRYAGPIRGLDHGVILDHGDYYTVVAKLAELALPVGTHVARGDHLGRAARRRVYLEVRVKAGPGGLPIDPEPLLR